SCALVRRSSDRGSPTISSPRFLPPSFRRTKISGDASRSFTKWMRKAEAFAWEWAMILVFGSINVDLVARVPVIPGPGRTVLAPSYEIHFGGKGANQAVAAARIAGPGKVRMAGR